MRRKVGLLAIVVAVFTLGRASAQPAIPDGSFVRDSADNTWLVSGGQRSVVPIREADDADILALPISGRWVVASALGLVELGDKPDWADEPAAVKLDDDPPKVSVQLSADEADRGSTVDITIVATDDHAVDWVEWEGDVERNAASTNDPVLTTIHRFECEGQPSCTRTMKVTLTGQGKFVITGRARDLTGQRSDATAELTIR